MFNLQVEYVEKWLVFNYFSTFMHKFSTKIRIFSTIKSPFSTGMAKSQAKRIMREKTSAIIQNKKFAAVL